MLSTSKFEVTVPMLEDFISHWMTKIGDENYAGFHLEGHNPAFVATNDKKAKPQRVKYTHA